MNLSKLSDSARQQLWTNLLKAEKEGKMPEKCAALRKQFEELREKEANFFKSMANFGLEQRYKNG